MANYQTHKNIGITSSILISSPIYILSVSTDKLNFLNNFQFNSDINIYTFVLMMIFGFIGSIFPDIDLSTSKPTKLIKYIMYIFVMILNIILFNEISLFLLDFFKNHHYVFFYEKEYRMFFITGFFILLSPFIFTNMIFSFIQIVTKHRGVIHSIPFAFLTSLILYIGLDTDLIHSFSDNLNINMFFIMLMFFLGNLVHFILDETYSVDFKNKKIKKSIWTAFTFVSRKNVNGYVFMYALISLIMYLKFSYVELYFKSLI